MVPGGGSPGVNTANNMFSRHYPNEISKNNKPPPPPHAYTNT